MKMNMLLGSLMLGASLCTPSFGGGLLDRMLGLKGAGCDSTCCDTGCNVDPSCGCESAKGCGLKGLLRGPSCGCESACGNGCAADPSCGCESAKGCGLKGLLHGPSCGCESACGNGCAAAPSCGCESACSKPRRKPLMELLAALKPSKSCCDNGCAAAPSCGCESACGNGCGAAPSCGCESACGNGNGCGNGCGAAPSCGCETACGNGCDAGPGRIAKMHHRLLSKLFKKRGGCDSLACDACTPACSSCGSAPVSAPAVHSEAAPMAPAPVVDPSAYLQSNRRVVQATSYVR